MNNLLGYGTSLARHIFRTDLLPPFLQTVRNKAKKSNSSKRNPKQAKGQHFGLKFLDGSYVRNRWILATQPRLRYHGGLNVGMGSSFTLMSLTEGRVVITAEKTDLNFDHSWNQKFYAGNEGVAIYKKYVHVIPTTKHTRFKVIDQV